MKTKDDVFAANIVKQLQSNLDPATLTEKIKSQLALPQLVQLSKAYHGFGIHILEDPELCNELNGNDLGILASSNSEAAMRILAESELCNKLNGNDLGILAYNNSEAAMRILAESELYNKLDAHGLRMLAYNNSEAGMRILAEPGLCNKLDGHGLGMLAFNNPEAGMHILAEPELCSKLDGYDLGMLAYNNSEAGIRILAEPGLCNKIYSLDGCALGMLASHNSEVGIRILAEPGLCNKIYSLDGYYLGMLASHNSEAGMRILKEPELCNKLDGCALGMLASNNSEAGMRILKEPGLCNKLDGCALGMLASNNSEAAMRILKEPELCNKLDGHDLGILASNNLEASMSILEDPMNLITIPTSFVKQMLTTCTANMDDIRPIAEKIILSKQHYLIPALLRDLPIDNYKSILHMAHSMQEEDFCRNMFKYVLPTLDKTIDITMLINDIIDMKLPINEKFISHAIEYLEKFGQKLDVSGIVTHNMVMAKDANLMKILLAFIDANFVTYDHPDTFENYINHQPEIYINFLHECINDSQTFKQCKELFPDTYKLLENVHAFFGCDNWFWEV
ncbi:MAG: hypothetical protein AB8B67_00940 [Rickettsiaceae bacterium]